MNLRQLKQRWRQRRLALQLRGPALQLRQALQALQATTQPLPVLVVAYNNGIHVASMARQLRERGLRPIVIDNASDDSDTLQTLRSLVARGEAWWVRCAHNHGHQVGFLPPMYAELPPVFAYTDPDLQLNPALPADFLQTLAALTERYRVFKAGLALDLGVPAPMVNTRQRLQTLRPIPYEAWLSVREWEAPYWRFPIASERWPVYAAPVDTTFAVCNKAHYRGQFTDGVRVAGPYAALHLPWFPSLDPMDPAMRQHYLRRNRSTTWVSAPPGLAD